MRTFARPPRGGGMSTLAMRRSVSRARLTTALVALALARVASGAGFGMDSSSSSSSPSPSSNSPAPSASRAHSSSSSSTTTTSRSKNNIDIDDAVDDAVYPPCPADAPPGHPCIPRDLATESGYMRVGAKGSSDDENARLFFLYQEADPVLQFDAALKKQKQKKTAAASSSSSTSSSPSLSKNETSKTPIIIWLQGGPGSSSLLGALFEMGRYVIDDGGDGSLRRNAQSWTRSAAMLFVESPLGVGFSLAGKRRLPATSADAAVDLVSGLQNFFVERTHLAGRPLVLAGESYAGKYVPEAAALALQLASDDEATRAAAFKQANGEASNRPSNSAAAVNSSAPAVVVLPPPSSPLAFALRGAAVGNGLVDPPSQAARMGPYLYARGLINSTTLKRNERRAANLTSLASRGLWAEAHVVREAMVASLTRSALGKNGTLLDWRRTEGYDAADRVKAFLRTPAARHALLGADAANDEAPSWQRRAKSVAAALHDDKAVSAAPVVAEVVTQVPFLLYYGVEDAKDGYYSSQPWISALVWPGSAEFKSAKPRPLPPRPEDGVSGGTFRSGGGLTVVTVADAGHMVPADQPGAARQMIELWLRECVLPSYEEDLRQGDSPAARRAAAAADAEVERRAEAAAEATATAEAAANAAAAAALAADAEESTESGR